MTIPQTELPLSAVGVHPEQPWAGPTLSTKPFPWHKVTATLRAVWQRLLPWLVPVTLIALWQIASSLGWLSTRVLPVPLEVITAFWTLTASGELWR